MSFDPGTVMIFLNIVKSLYPHLIDPVNKILDGEVYTDEELREIVESIDKIKDDLERLDNTN